MNPIRLRLLSEDPNATDRLRKQLTLLGYRVDETPSGGSGPLEWALELPDPESPPAATDPPVAEAILGMMNEPVLTCSPDGTLSRANSSARKLFPEAAEGAPLNQWPQTLPLYQQDGRTPLAPDEPPLIRALSEGPVGPFELVAYDTVGVPRTFTTHARPITDATGSPRGAAMVLRDLTQQRYSEERLRRERDLYAALSEVNQFVVLQEPDPDSVFEAVCYIAVAYGGLRLAWVGVPDDEGWVRPAAAYGDASDYLDQMAISTAPDRPEGQGPTGVAMREERHVVEPNIITDPDMSPWHAAADAAGLRSSAAFPIHRGGEVAASLNVYADEPHFFNDDLVHLLDEMVLDISFALDHYDRMAERRRLAEIIEATPDFVGMADPDGNILYHNPAARQLLGREQLEGTVSQTHTAPSLARLRQEGFPTAREHGLWRGETHFRTGEGDVRPFSQTIIGHRDPQGELTHFSTIARDMSAQKQAEAEIQRLTYRDTVTGLPNRASLKDRLDQEVSRAQHQGTYGALLYLDLDEFKAINDSLGHPVGDLLLQTLAERFRERLRPEDVVARVGGDEFAVLIPDLSTEAGEAAQLAEQVGKDLLAALEKPCQIGENRLVATASVGITLFPERGIGRDTLLQQADTAMFSAKAEGPGSIRFFQHRMLETVRYRLDLGQELRAALERQELTLHYQPLISLADESVLGLEALLRWHHPQRGWISPAEFIPVAEESGLILDVGEWVLQEAFRQLEEWREAGLWPGPLGLGINISPRQFAQEGFLERTAAMLEEAGVPGEWIKLEITENLLIQHLGTAVERMEALRQMGLSFAIDDFGTGYSSLAYIHQLPVTTLKVDRSLVAEADRSPSSAVIVEAVLAMADHLDLSVVAEGVETRSQAAFLAERSATAGQGFLWSPALPGPDLHQRLPSAPEPRTGRR